MFQQAGAQGDVTLGQMEPSPHIWSNHCMLQSLPTLFFFWPPIWGNTITRSTQFVRYQVLVSGYQIPVTRDSVQRAVWVAERLIYLPEKTQQGSSVQPTLALSTGDVGTGWLGRTSKPTCMSWGCLSFLQTWAADEATTAKASALRAVWHCSSS